MIGVGFRKGEKITLEASYSDSELDLAIALGESLATHNKGKVLVYLYNKGKPKVKILKTIKRVNTGFFGLRQKVVVK